MGSSGGAGHRSWWYGLIVAGAALVAATVLLALSTATTANAQVDCTLTITKTANVTQVPIGGDITYTLTVTNASDPAATCSTGITVTDTIPANTDCISASASGSGSFAAAGCTTEGNVVWTSGADLADAATATLTMTVRVSSGTADGTVIPNSATVAGVSGVPAGVTSATVNVTVNDCDLSIRKSDSVTEVGEGGEITYTITVENEGTADCADVVIIDTIPTDTDCVGTDVVEGESDVAVGDADGCDASGDVTWEVTEGTLDGLEEGEVAEVQMTVRLTSGAEEDDEIENTACVTSDDSDLEICEPERTRVGEAVTPTPQPTATARPTVMPTISPPPPVAPPPVVPPAVLPTLAPPPTGTGPDGIDFARPLALALGLAGGSLLLAAGAVRMRRTR